MIYAQPSLKEALKTFGDCLCAGRNQLEVRDLKDFYRVRGVPDTCCRALAATLLSNDLTKSIKGLDNSNCRINAFFIEDNVFDPHTHPLNFVSYVVHGGYTQIIFNKESNIVNNKTNNHFLPCVPRLNQICTEYSKIDTITDTVKKVGTVKLTRAYEKSFYKGELIIFNDTNMIHTITNLMPDTLTINFISDVGDKEIDVFISHKTPMRQVLSKTDTRLPIKTEISKGVIDKCIQILQSE